MLYFDCYINFCTYIRCMLLKPAGQCTAPIMTETNALELGDFDHCTEHDKVVDFFVIRTCIGISVSINYGTIQWLQ